MRILLAALFASSVFAMSSTLHVASADDVIVTSSALAPSESELALFNLTNQDRVRAGLTPLTFDTDLLTVARTRGEAQQSEPSLTHFDGSGQLAFVGLITTANVPYLRAGENLARVPTPATNAAERAEQALMQSPTHRANILQPEFDHLAIGQTVDSSGRIVFAEIFRATP
jgi:uncharacterized protein YkwD